MCSRVFRSFHRKFSRKTNSVREAVEGCASKGTMKKSTHTHQPTTNGMNREKKYREK